MFTSGSYFINASLTVFPLQTLLQFEGVSFRAVETAQSSQPELTDIWEDDLDLIIHFSVQNILDLIAQNHSLLLYSSSHVSPPVLQW